MEWDEIRDRDHAWNEALEDLFGADAKGINGKANRWKKCIFHNSRSSMTDQDWEDIKTEYPRV